MHPRECEKDIERRAFAEAKRSGRVMKDRDEMADRLQKAGKAANRLSHPPGHPYTSANG